MPSLICPELPQDIKKHLNIEASYSALSVNHCPPVSLVNPQREHISADFLLGSRTTSSRAELPWGTRAARLCVSLYISLHALWNISMCQIWSLKATEEVCKVKSLCLIHTNTQKKTTEHRSHPSWSYELMMIYLYISVFQKRVLHLHYSVNVVITVSAEPPGTQTDNGLPSKGCAFLHSRLQWKMLRNQSSTEGEAGMERIRETEGEHKEEWQ